jgi:hypothetical protein
LSQLAMVLFFVCSLVMHATLFAQAESKQCVIYFGARPCVCVCVCVFV